MAGRILSIQSHVARGYVGNKVSVFPLQLLGHDVDFINTVQYTSMYIHVGEITSEDTVARILGSLAQAQEGKLLESQHPGDAVAEKIADDLPPLDHKFVLTGHMGKPELLNTVVAYLREQRMRRKASFIWVCDPVLGDNDRLYVPPGMIEAYRSHLDCVNILTPNQFELQWLSSEPAKKIENVEGVISACRDLHLKGVPKIVVTSFRCPKEALLYTLTSEISEDGTQQAIMLAHYPSLTGFLGGLGDLLAAMIVHGLDKNLPFSESCLQAVNIARAAMRRTLESNPAAYELNLIKNQDIITHPPPLEGITTTKLVRDLK